MKMRDMEMALRVQIVHRNSSQAVKNVKSTMVRYFGHRQASALPLDAVAIALIVIGLVSNAYLLRLLRNKKLRTIHTTSFLLMLIPGFDMLTLAALALQADMVLESFQLQNFKCLSYQTVYRFASECSVWTVTAVSMIQTASVTNLPGANRRNQSQHIMIAVLIVSFCAIINSQVAALYGVQQNAEIPWLGPSPGPGPSNATRRMAALNVSDTTYLCTFRPEYSFFVQNVWSWVDFCAYAGAPAPLNMLAGILLVHRVRKHGLAGQRAFSRSRMQLQLAVKNVVFLVTVLPGGFLRLRRQLFCSDDRHQQPCLAHLGILSDNVMATNDLIKLFIVINHASTLFIFVLVDTLIRKKFKSAIGNLMVFLRRLDCRRRYVTRDVVRRPTQSRMSEQTVCSADLTRPDTLVPLVVMAPSANSSRSSSGRSTPREKPPLGASTTDVTNLNVSTAESSVILPAHR